MKRKKHPRLRNGLGSIKYLGSGRSNPYAVYPPEYRISDRGNMSYKRALCYVPDWYTGFAVLVSFAAGTYHPGDEIDIARKAAGAPAAPLDDLSRKILADYRLIQNHEIASPRLFEVWDEYMEQRFGPHASKKFSVATKTQYTNARRFFAPLADKPIVEISLSDLQSIIDTASEKYSRKYLQVVVAAVSNVYTHAINHDLIQVNYPRRIVIPLSAKEPVSGLPFDRDELRILWRKAREGDAFAQALVVHCYSGFRISAFYDHFVVDLDRMVFEGGVKTYRRPVPILPEIRPFVHDPVYPVSLYTVYKSIHDFCRENGLRDHTSHDCRHTFKALLDRAGVAPVAQRVLMGHSVGQDVHDRVYTHLDVEDLRREMSKIRIEF